MRTMLKAFACLTRKGMVPSWELKSGTSSSHWERR
ncbi:hypothetical protein LEMLEM_LOCUS15326 [Lemmus lemmus]